MDFFYDWLNVYQDFDYELPLVGDRANIVIDTDTGDQLSITQPTMKYEGSYSTSINIRVSGNRISISGNPSRVNRLDNLFGLTTLEQCFSVYNSILHSLGLPAFTKCSKVFLLSGEDGSKVKTSSDGAIITELHITSNVSVGSGCVDDYIRAISTQHYRNMKPRLHTNGQTCDYLNTKGKASSLIYPSIYNKAFELHLHTLPKYIRRFGDQSPEVNYLKKLINYCTEQGVARFEQKLKSQFLRKNNFRFYGLFDEKKLVPYQEKFLNIDNKLEAMTAMTFENISQKLIRLHVVDSTLAANTTAMYFVQWMHGSSFDLSKSAVKKHRARLRKIGFDIADTFDVSRHNIISIVRQKEIVVSSLSMPEWYKKASTLRLVA